MGLIRRLRCRKWSQAQYPFPLPPPLESLVRQGKERREEEEEGGESLFKGEALFPGEGGRRGLQSFGRAAWGEAMCSSSSSITSVMRDGDGIGVWGFASFICKRVVQSRIKPSSRDLLLLSSVSSSSSPNRGVGSVHTAVGVGGPGKATFWDAHSTPLGLWGSWAACNLS